MLEEKVRSTYFLYTWYNTPKTIILEKVDRLYNMQIK